MARHNSNLIHSKQNRMRMFLIFLWCFVLIQAKDCPGICGDAVEYINGQPDPNYQKQVTKTTSNGNNRIVNGYSVKDRGFVTLIRAYDPNDKEFYESCGGTLLNDLHILTAGHCVCMQNKILTLTSSAAIMVN